MWKEARRDKTPVQPKPQFGARPAFKPRYQIQPRPQVPNREPEKKANPFISSKMVCYNCKKPGHFAKDCRAPKAPSKDRINMIDENELLCLGNEEWEEWLDDIQLFRAQARDYQDIYSLEEEGMESQIQQDF